MQRIDCINILYAKQKLDVHEIHKMKHYIWIVWDKTS